MEYSARFNSITESIHSPVKVSIFSLLILAVLSLNVYAEDQPGEGEIAPNFSITDLDGKTFSLSDYRGKKPVYLVFWNTWCTYCMKKIPKLKHAQAELNDEIEIIAVNTGLKDSVEKSIAFKQRFKINYPLAFDHDKKVTDLYGVWGTPTEFIIDINGIIQLRDGIPDEIEPELANWSRLIEPDSSKIVLEDCNTAEKTC